MNDEFEQQQKLARAFIQSYLSARQGLTELGKLRSERNLQGEYAEWWVANILGLQLAASTVEKGIDATDKDGRTYQIKSRIVKSLNQNTSFDFVDISTSFDTLVSVFFSPTFELLGLMRDPFEFVSELGAQNLKKLLFLLE